jgi:hypothetical protein
MQLSFYAVCGNEPLSTMEHSHFLLLAADQLLDELVEGELECLDPRWK